MMCLARVHAQIVCARMFDTYRILEFVQVVLALIFCGVDSPLARQVRLEATDRALFAGRENGRVRVPKTLAP